jgi:hypothetical protein
MGGRNRFRLSGAFVEERVHVRVRFIRRLNLGEIETAPAFTVQLIGL